MNIKFIKIFSGFFVAFGAVAIAIGQVMEFIIMLRKVIYISLILYFSISLLPAKYICAEGAKGFWCSTSKMGIGTYYAHYKHPKINHFGGHLSVSSLYWKERFGIGVDISGGLGEQKISSDFLTLLQKTHLVDFWDLGYILG